MQYRRVVSHSAQCRSICKWKHRMKCQIYSTCLMFAYISLKVVATCTSIQILVKFCDKMFISRLWNAMYSSNLLWLVFKGDDVIIGDGPCLVNTFPNTLLNDAIFDVPLKFQGTYTIIMIFKCNHLHYKPNEAATALVYLSIFSSNFRVWCHRLTPPFIFWLACL